MLVVDLGIEVDVVVVDCAVEGEGDHLRHSVARRVSWTETSGYFGAVIAAEAIRKSADGGVTLRGAVRIIFLVCE